MSVLSRMAAQEKSLFYGLTKITPLTDNGDDVPTGKLELEYFVADIRHIERNMRQYRNTMLFLPYIVDKFNLWSK